MKHTTAKKLIKSQEGFTLIELLVVIGILAILLAITLIAINPARQFAQARDTERRNAATQILNSFGGYFADHGGVLPTQLSLSGDSTYFDLNSTRFGADCYSLVNEYIPALPINPNVGSGSGDCSGVWNTGYSIMKDTNNRLVITASSEVYQIDQTGTEYITVTR